MARLPPQYLPHRGAEAMAEEPSPRASFGRTLRTVLWSFFGVRKSSDHARDTAGINPVHVIVAGLLATAIFVLVLILIVRSVVK